MFLTMNFVTSPAATLLLLRVSKSNSRWRKPFKQGRKGLQGQQGNEERRCWIFLSLVSLLSLLSLFAFLP